MKVDVAVLGELRVTLDGLDVTPTPSKERALVAFLAIHRNQVVAVGRILEELWPALDPERGRHVLQVRVAAIRKLLARAGGGHLLESVPPGYRLQLGPEALDVDRFAALVEQAWSAPMPTTPSAPLRCYATRWGCGEANRSPTWKARCSSKAKRRG